MVFTNAGETISYKNTKTENQFDVLFGVTLWSLILSIPSLALFLIPGSGTLFSGFDLKDLGFIALATVLAISSICLWSIASRHLPMSIAEGVSEIYIAFLTFFSWLFFGGRLTIWHIVLIVIVVVACLLLAFIQNRNNNVKSYNFKRGFLFLAFWVVVYIIRGLIPGALANSGMNGVTYNLLLNLMMFIIVLIVMIIKKRLNLKTIFTVLKDPWLFVIGLCRTSSQISLVYLALKMNLGVVDAVSVFGIVLIMLYERLIMKEKISWQSYIILVFIAIATAMLMVI